MKSKIRDYENALQEKDNQLKNMRQDVRVTRVTELEVQSKTYLAEVCLTVVGTKFKFSSDSAIAMVA